MKLYYHESEDSGGPRVTALIARVRCFSESIRSRSRHVPVHYGKYTPVQRDKYFFSVPSRKLEAKKAKNFFYFFTFKTLTENY